MTQVLIMFLGLSFVLTLALVTILDNVARRRAERYQIMRMQQQALAIKIEEDAKLAVELKKHF